MNTEKQYQHLDLKPYSPFGIPLLKFLFGVALISLFVIATYEFII